ncbi:MAG TPA: helix-turn-helix transcriptional regulator, partial [Thermoanaerobaculia bacterium]|nr:helix-turn-helix transcriptional regulator [Thermoanaerobaculia bacterium]
MKLLHEELRRAREKAGLSQQALADLAGIPRNQIVRAERGENITVDTLRKIAAHLPVTELTLLDTTGFRVDIFADPEKLLLGALENVVRLADALRGAVHLAMDARAAVETARRLAPPPLEGQQHSADIDPILLLRRLERVAVEIDEISREAKIAS